MLRILFLTLPMVFASNEVCLGGPFLLSNNMFTINIPNTSAEPHGINNAGQIVGHDESNGGYLLSNGSVSFFNRPGGVPADTFLYNINNAGHIVGHDDLGAFLLANGVFTALPEVPGSDPNSTTPGAINDADEIVGNFNPGGRLDGFLYVNGVFTTFAVPGSIGTSPAGINNSGQIFGWFTDMINGQFRYHGFVYAN